MSDIHYGCFGQKEPCNGGPGCRLESAAPPASPPREWDDPADRGSLAPAPPPGAACPECDAERAAGCLNIPAVHHTGRCRKWAEDLARRAAANVAPLIEKERAEQRAPLPTDRLGPAAPPPGATAPVCSESINSPTNSPPGGTGPGDATPSWDGQTCGQCVHYDGTCAAPDVKGERIDRRQIPPTYPACLGGFASLRTAVAALRADLARLTAERERYRADAQNAPCECGTPAGRPGGDAWKCAVRRSLPRIACTCQCHRYLSACDCHYSPVGVKTEPMPPAASPPGGTGAPYPLDYFPRPWTWQRIALPGAPLAMCWTLNAANGRAVLRHEGAWDPAQSVMDEIAADPAALRAERDALGVDVGVHLEAVTAVLRAFGGPTVRQFTADEAAALDLLRNATVGVPNPATNLGARVEAAEAEVARLTAEHKADADALTHLRRVAYLRDGTTGPEIEKHLRAIVDDYAARAAAAEAERDAALAQIPPLREALSLATSQVEESEAREAHADELAIAAAHERDAARLEAEEALKLLAVSVRADRLSEANAALAALRDATREATNVLDRVLRHLRTPMRAFLRFGENDDPVRAARHQAQEDERKSIAGEIAPIVRALRDALPAEPKEKD
jgi:hypothetical protein